MSNELKERKKTDLLQDLIAFLFGCVDKTSDCTPFSNKTCLILTTVYSILLIISNIFLYKLTIKKYKEIRDPTINKNRNSIYIKILVCIATIAWTHSACLIHNLFYIYITKIILSYEKE